MKSSGSKRIAERYVKALFEVSLAASVTEDVEKDLHALKKVVSESNVFRQFLANPLWSAAQRAEVMLAILEKMQVNQITRQFIGLLLGQKRLVILPEVIDMFLDWAGKARGELKAELISATPLDSKEIKQISDRLSKAYGRSMKLEVRQDPSLLGGLILKIGSLQLDVSVSGKLQRLQSELKAA